MATYEEAKKILDKFRDEYFDTAAIPGMNGFGLSKVRIRDPKAKQGLDDLCLLITLEKPLPQDHKVPESYEGMKVYTEVVGEITLE